MTNEQYSEIMIAFAKLEARLEKIEQQIAKMPIKRNNVIGMAYGTDDSCIWKNINPEDLNKPMGISCPCKRCSTYSMG